MKTTEEAGVVDMGMVGYHSLQETRSFKKAIAYIVVAMLTPADEDLAIGYSLKGLSHLIRNIGRTTK